MTLYHEPTGMASNTPHRREKRTSFGTVTLVQNTSSGQVIMTVPSQARQRGNIPASPGDELEVVEVVDEHSGETRLELQPVE